MDEQWRQVAVYADPVSAAAVAGLLHSEGVPARIASDEPVPGLMRSYAIMTPASYWARAQQVCSQAPLSEEEWSQYDPGSPQDEE